MGSATLRICPYQAPHSLMDRNLAPDRRRHQREGGKAKLQQERWITEEVKTDTVLALRTLTLFEH